MTKEVDVGRRDVNGRAADELDLAGKLAARVIITRIQTAENKGDHEAVVDALAELLWLCAEDGVRRETIKEQDGETLQRLIQAALGGLIDA